VHDFQDDRVKMIEEIRNKYKFDSPKVFSAMLRVPREEFTPESYKENSYKDGPIPIGYGQTMSQPYTVAFMTHILSLKGGEKILEVGTGSGYQAAVLSKLVKKIYTIEIIKDLAIKTQERLKSLGFKNVAVREGSGEWGWRENAPFDAILITAGVGEKIPEELFEELKEGGILVAPIGKGYDKTMTRFRKIKLPRNLKGAGRNFKIEKEEFGIFHFVPFVEEPH